jgi:hypothetical protein
VVRVGGDLYFRVDPMVAETARNATVKLVPR